MSLEIALKRFHSKYKIESLKGCWEWTEYTSKDGYGRFYYNRTTWEAHRFAFRFIKNLEIKNLLVCHTCDNPCCVNPEHLFLGTDKINSDDKISKGRNVNVKCQGEENAHAKLKEFEVQELRILIYLLPAPFLRAYYKVSQDSINRIAKKVSWKYLSAPSESEILQVKNKFSKILHDI